MCNKVSDDCESCALENVQKNKIKYSTQNVSSDVKRFNLQIVHDLAFSPVVGLGGEKYLSVTNIVCSVTRFTSVLAIKSKTDALTHLMKYCYRWKLENKPKPDAVLTDNGLEFVNTNYSEYCKKECIVVLHGAPYTPETQSLVERTNRKIKGLIIKVLHQLNLPHHLWPVILPGVVNQINDVVHTATGKSPNKMVYGTVNSVVPLTLGDVVVIRDPKETDASWTPKGENGIFCGVINSNNVSVLVNRQSRWRGLRLHPRAIMKLRSWSGIKYDVDGVPLLLKENNEENLEELSEEITNSQHEDILPSVNKNTNASDSEIISKRKDPPVNATLQVESPAEVTEQVVPPTESKEIKLNGVLVKDKQRNIFPARVVKSGKPSRQLQVANSR
eukprot:GHVR01044669.1.p1 GENE.GHVR01044669.1~~GHVR01044669.1.p1  ORF type:complete len:388 (-),score=54.44 GHVR01044669.1:2118-3281(-)